MQTINIFYHMFCINDHVDRFFKTYNKLNDSKLLTNNKMWVIMTGPESEQTKIKIPHTNNVIPILKSTSIGETETLNFLFEKSFENPNGVTLYLHSKGVSKPNNNNVNAWVDYMEHFCINQYNTCLNALEKFDAVGVELKDSPMKHFSGNFWWATNKYLQTRELITKEAVKNKIITDQRWYCEFWLLDDVSCKPISLHESNVDLYGTNYGTEKYCTQFK